MSADLLLPLLMGLVGSLIGTGGLAGLWLIPAQRRKYDMDGATAVATSAVVLVEPLETRIRSLGAEVDDTRRQLRLAQNAAEELAQYLRRVVRDIHDPAMTLERLRALVGDGPTLPPTNGRSVV